MTLVIGQVAFITVCALIGEETIMKCMVDHKPLGHSLTGISKRMSLLFVYTSMHVNT